jgi:actin-like ATPase involved in cell morphogenesis
MSYRVGIDFGTTFTAAAVHRDGEQVAELVPLGDNKPAAASVIFVAPDGSLVMGDAAVRRAVTDPDRVVREVKRRVGDQTPVLVAGEPIDAHTLAACFVRWVVDRVTEREGAPPAAVALTHPASWGQHKCALFTEALAEQGIESITLVAEPAAAAVAYTASQHVEPGSAIGVYDLGGGTFDAAVVRQLAEGGFELIGSPEGLESLGGVDFDEAVFEHVREIVGTQWTELDFTDPLVRTAAATLRRECTDAKEALSADTEVTIPVMLPGVSTRVRMVRPEFEQLVGPAIDATVEALRAACASAGLAPGDLSAVLLVGGSSRIPLVAQRVSGAFDRPVTVDSDPKAVVATGAVLSIAPAAARPAERTTVAETLRPPVPAFRPRRALTIGVGVVACLAALVVTASAVGTDLIPGGNAAQVVADPITTDGPREVLDKESVGAPAPGETDPWTGEPYRETTQPGPSRPGAKPAAATPAALTPAPTTGGDRDAQVDGAPPSTNTVSPPPDPDPTGPTGPTDPTGVTTTEEPPPVTTTEEPPPVTTTEEPPPVTTTEEPPPVTTTEEPPPVGTEGESPAGTEETT